VRGWGAWSRPERSLCCNAGPSGSPSGQAKRPGALRIVRPFVPQIEEAGVDELILAMQEEVRQGHPFTIEVDEGNDGEQVQIHFC